MKSLRLFSRFTPLLALSVVPVLGGCVFIKAPAPLPIPTPVPTPYGVQFDPSEGSPKGTALNNQEGETSNPALPDAFRLASIASGQELVLQSVKKIPSTTPGGKPQVILGAADTLNPVRLAGILVPTGNQTGAGEAIAIVQTWIGWDDFDVDIDPVFPTDTDTKRRVEVFFTGRTGEFKDQRFSLNRMMVRSGYAIVDLYSPTSFDQSQWLYDETFARENNLGLWKTDAFRRLQQRVKLPSRGTGAKSSVTIATPAPALVAPGQSTAASLAPSSLPASSLPSSSLPPSSPRPPSPLPAPAAASGG